MSSLWLGEDHLVHVRGEGFVQAYTEDYRRYRYRDIQAFTITPTSRVWLFLLYILCAVFFLSLLAAIVTAREPGAMSGFTVSMLGVLAVFAGWFLFLLARHWILGPTCRCDIHTSLKSERIRPITRLHQARQSLDTISGKISAAQADLEKGGTTVSAGSQSENSDSRISLSIPPPVLPNFCLFALFGILGLAALHLGSFFLVGACLVLMLLGSAFQTATLITSIRKQSPDTIRTLLWSLLGLGFLFVASASVYLIYVVTYNPVYTLDLSGPLEAFAAITTEGGIVFYLVFLFLLLGIVIVSVLGIVSTIRWKNRITSAGRNE